jgi:hypothetical protein
VGLRRSARSMYDSSSTILRSSSSIAIDERFLWTLAPFRSLA